jgi:hypothetical protein
MPAARPARSGSHKRYRPPRQSTELEVIVIAAATDRTPRGSGSVTARPVLAAGLEVAGLEQVAGDLAGDLLGVVAELG